MTPPKPQPSPPPARRWPPSNPLMLFRDLSRHLPLALLAVALLLTAFAYGGVVGKYQVFPYRIIADGAKTAWALRDLGSPGDCSRGRSAPDVWGCIGLSSVASENAASSRIEFIAGGPLQAPVLWTGGHYRFLDLCPESGCLAVEYSANGEVVHAWPYLPDELERAANASAAGALPYELALNFSFADHVFIGDVARYDNGDLLVTFQSGTKSFPYAAGVARIDPAGHPVYFRRDYSHHLVHIAADDTALVPGLQIGSESITFALGRETVTIECATGKPYRDTVNIISGDGRLLRSIDLVTALAESPYAPLLRQTPNTCDPLHLNSVRRIENLPVGAGGIAVGDLVVSLRNLSAFAILGGETYHIKRVVRGSFNYQHSVEHLYGTKFMMFDNQAGGEGMSPSRLLMFDLADGSETTVFPHTDTLEDWHMYSEVGGYVNISPDRNHAIVVFDTTGKALEIRIADGVVLNTFANLHDVSDADEFGEARHNAAFIFRLQGLDYIHHHTGG